LESRVTKLQEKKTYFEICPQDFQNEIKMDSFHTSHVQQHIDFQSNGDATLQHWVEPIRNAIVPEIKDELHLMEKRLENNLEKLMEGTKQEIQSIESNLHNMLKMELDSIISLSVQL
jgi:hypothetical protein